MQIIDPIADILTRLRNAQIALHKEVSVPESKMKSAIIKILLDEGYVAGVDTSERDMKVTLKYVDGKAALSGLKRISKPGRKVYVSKDRIPMVQNGLGICILSTSQGIMSGHKANKVGVGGELLCEIW